MPLGSSRPIRGRATFTTVESRNTIPEPRIAAISVQRCAGLMPFTSGCTFSRAAAPSQERLRLLKSGCAFSTGRAPRQLVRRCAGVRELARRDRYGQAARQWRERADPLRVVVTALVVGEAAVEHEDLAARTQVRALRGLE